MSGDGCGLGDLGPLVELLQNYLTCLGENWIGNEVLLSKIVLFIDELSLGLSSLSISEHY